MNRQCAAIHCSIATKMASGKRVTDKTTSRLTGIGTNLLRFKTCQVSVTHPVFKRGVKIVSSVQHTIWEIMPQANQEQTVIYILPLSSIFNTLMKNLSIISNSRNKYHLTNMNSKLKQLQICWQSTDQVPCKIQGAQISKNLGATLKFQVPEGWHEGSSILRNHKYYVPTYKIKSPMWPGIRNLCTSGTINNFQYNANNTDNPHPRRFKSDLEFYIFL